MSLVERLVAKRREWEGASLPFHPDYEEARFWLCAIADELEASGLFCNEKMAARWLRDEASK